MRTLTLTVLESYTRDVNAFMARIDYESMDWLEIRNRDLINIGKVMLTVQPLYPSDAGKNIIRINKMLRDILGLKIGDNVEVSGVEFN